jgi:hypothetical protein
LRQQTLALQEQDNLMNSSPDISLGSVDNKVRVFRRLVRVVNTCEALDLACARFRVDTAPVRLLRVVKRRGDVYEEERSVFLNSFSRLLSRLLERCNGRDNGGGTSLGQLGGDEGNARNVLVTVFSREAELRRQF